jgi:hypothetical protein
MTRLLLPFLTALLLCACASPQQRAQVDDFQKWRENRQSQARTGQIPWSIYYSELWSRMNNLPSDPQKPLMLETTAKLIPLARQYEAGQISKEQFEDARRIVISGHQQGQQNIQQRQQAINDAQAEQLYRIGNQVMQPRNPTVTCIKNSTGPGSSITNCN